MMNRDPSPLPVATSLDSTPGRALLCRVMDVDLGVGFGDMIVRCLAHCDGQVELLDLMFAAIDVQILESTIADTRLAASVVGNRQTAVRRLAQMGIAVAATRPARTIRGKHENVDPLKAGQRQEPSMRQRRSDGARRSAAAPRTAPAPAGP